MSVAMPVTPGQPAPHPTPVGRLRQEGLSDSDRNYAMAIHLTALLGVFPAFHLALIVPFVLWLVRKDESSYVGDHGREMMNVFLTAIILFVSVIGIPFLLPWGIVTFINFIRGAVAAKNGEYFRYPMTIRFLS